MSEPYQHIVANGQRGRHAAGPTDQRRAPDYGPDFAVPADFVVGAGPGPTHWSQEPSEPPASWEISAEHQRPADHIGDPRSEQRKYPPAVEYLRHSAPPPNEPGPFVEPSPQTGSTPVTPGPMSGTQPAVTSGWITGDQPAIAEGYVMPGGYGSDPYPSAEHPVAPAVQPPPQPAQPVQPAPVAPPAPAPEPQIDSPTDEIARSRAAAGERTEAVTPQDTGQSTPPARQRLQSLTVSVGELVSGCRTLATDLNDAAQSRHDPRGTDPARVAALYAARLLQEAAEASEGVLHLLEAARDSLDGPPRNGVRHSGTDPGPESLSHTVEHVAAADTANPNGAVDVRLGTLDSPSAPEHEAAMPPELSSAAPSYPPVLPLGLRDGAQAAVVARQVESARRHLQAALAVGHDVGDPAWRQQLLGMIEQVLAAVTEVASVARDALAPSASETTFPGEARFLCVLPWERVSIAAPERMLSPASVAGTATLLASLGYDARPARGDQGPPQIELRGGRYSARIILQQLRLTGAGEWMTYLDWADADGQSNTAAETLGPAEISDDELARRIDDALRRRLGGQPAD